MPKTDKVEGFVIRRRNMGEADRILTLFTKEHGKISVKAPNVRKIASRRAPHIELANHALFSLYKGRALPIVTEAQTIESFHSVKSDLQKVAYVYHLCELIDGLTAENQEHLDIFSLFLQTLHTLVISETPSRLIHQFEIKLLTYLGFWSEEKFRSADDVHTFIEDLLERKLRSKKIIMLFR